MPEDVSIAGGLELVAAFVNTRDLATEEDALATPETLGAWLEGLGLPANEPTDADVQRAAELREGLRSLLHAHNAGDVDPAAVQACNAAARRAPLHVTVGDDGTVSLVPGGQGVDAALGRILAVVERAQAEGTWERLKACAAPECRWAYYDRSRNRSRTWCAMAVCGNRAKARAYRSRKP